MMLTRARIIWANPSVTLKGVCTFRFAWNPLLLAWSGVFSIGNWRCFRRSHSHFARGNAAHPPSSLRKDKVCGDFGRRRPKSTDPLLSFSLLYINGRVPHEMRWNRSCRSARCIRAKTNMVFSSAAKMGLKWGTSNFIIYLAASKTLLLLLQCVVELGHSWRVSWRKIGPSARRCPPCATRLSGFVWSLNTYLYCIIRYCVFLERHVFKQCDTLSLWMDDIVGNLW